MKVFKLFPQFPQALLLLDLKFKKKRVLDRDPQIFESLTKLKKRDEMEKPQNSRS